MPHRAQHVLIDDVDEHRLWLSLVLKDHGEAVLYGFEHLPGLSGKVGLADMLKRFHAVRCLADVSSPYSGLAMHCSDT